MLKVDRKIFLEMIISLSESGNDEELVNKCITYLGYTFIAEVVKEYDEIK